ncbi:hypothetical protein FGG08_004582 [Glutinoglossum americanum]|uniref:Cytochrome P450 n=1 Tax=Glutinoglossum americanum TaxID=1670608 RepID=A0A9P8I5F5_9PEZI|nr:hypothetical protein FGG08_004582 [Glutinoglossum americanum]
MTFALSPPFITSLISLLFLRLLYTAVAKSRKNAKFKSFALSNHCEPPPLQVDMLPYGIDRLAKFVTIKGDILDDFIAIRYYDTGYTHRFSGVSGEVVCTSDPQNIQAILALRFADFELGATRKENFAPLLGSGIFTSDGLEWEHSRAFLRPQFSREQISDLESAERHIVNLFRAIGPVAEGMWTKEVDLLELFYRFTLDTATEFLFGESTESQVAELSKKQGGGIDKDGPENQLKSSPKNPEPEMDFATAFTTAQDFLSWQLRFPSPLWPIIQLPIFSPYRRFSQALTIVHRFANKYVDIALKSAAKKPAMASFPPSSEKGGPRERFVMLEALAEKTQDRDQLRDQLLQILLAGRDTTASLLSWSFALLAQNPAIFSHLRSSILSTFGSAEPPDNSDNPITFTALKSCRPLSHFISEVLRLYPVLPCNFRVATHNTILPTGGGPDGKSPIAIREGQLVTYSVYVMHRRTDIWGEDAAEFKPERWEGRKAGWEYLPFNGGPRICLGRE